MCVVGAGRGGGGGGVGMVCRLAFITKTSLFKYIENFSPQKKKKKKKKKNENFQINILLKI